jgi:hypothetical protein
MDKKLQWLDSFHAQGNDGQAYKVMAYEHLMRVDLAPGRDHWEPMGVTEYRLDTGEHVDVRADGSMRVTTTGVELHTADGREHGDRGDKTTTKAAKGKKADAHRAGGRDTRH